MDEDYRTFILRCQSNDQQWNATPAFSVCPGAGPKSERFPFGDKILTQSSLNSHKSETETATAHSGSRNASLLLRKTSDSVHLCGNNNNKHWSEHMIGTSFCLMAMYICTQQTYVVFNKLPPFIITVDFKHSDWVRLIVLSLQLVWCCCYRGHSQGFSPYDHLNSRDDIPLYTTHGRFEATNGRPYVSPNVQIFEGFT